MGREIVLDQLIYRTLNKQQRARLIRRLASDIFRMSHTTTVILNVKHYVTAGAKKLQSGKRDDLQHYIK